LLDASCYKALFYVMYMKNALTINCEPCDTTIFIVDKITVAGKGGGSEGGHTLPPSQLLLAKTCCKRLRYSNRTVTYFNRAVKSPLNYIAVG